MAAVSLIKGAGSRGKTEQLQGEQKAEIVLSVLSKQTTIAEACRRHAITETTFARVGLVQDDEVF